jgi:XRE family transcriptional regulator, regulator of sulfur utilization
VAAKGTSRFDPAVGRRLRALREARGISLNDLARAAGVGKATVSGLENGTRNPTLETMYAIAAALSVPMSSLTLDPGAPARTATAVRGAAVVSTLLEVFHEPAATYEFYRIRVLPGASQTSPAHLPGVTEHLTVYRGQLIAGPVNAPLTAGPGDYLTWSADVPHLYEAAGPEEVDAALVIRTPSRPPRRTRRAGSTSVNR